MLKKSKCASPHFLTLVILTLEQRKEHIKTPKRVNPALDLLEKLIWRHGKCAYKPLRDKLCPARACHFLFDTCRLLIEHR
jgi:hypothetical protein